MVANWFGKGKKGLVFGIWNAHTSVGNILGGILAGKFLKKVILPNSQCEIFRILLPLKSYVREINFSHFEALKNCH